MPQIAPPSSPPLCPGCILTLSFSSTAPSLHTFPLPHLNSIALTKHTRDWAGWWAWEWGGTWALTFSQSRRLEVQDQGVLRCLDLFPWHQGPPLGPYSILIASLKLPAPNIVTLGGLELHIGIWGAPFRLLHSLWPLPWILSSFI